MELNIGPYVFEAKRVEAPFKTLPITGERVPVDNPLGERPLLLKVNIRRRSEPHWNPVSPKIQEQLGNSPHLETTITEDSRL